MTTSRFVLILSIVSVFLFNGALFSFIDSQLDWFTLSGFLILCVVVVIVFLFNLFFYSVFALIAPVLIKPFFIITALISGFALYYMLTYQVVLDKTMIGNIFNTQTSEASELFSFKLLFFVVLIGILPSLLMLKLRIPRPVNRLRVLLNFGLAFIFGAVFLYMNAASWLWVDKYASLLGGKILPWSYLINTGRYYAETSIKPAEQTPLPEGRFSTQDKTVVVLVIGETARAANFSLYGYSRKTNPLLEQEDVLVLNPAKSCATYTTGSVACMLSHDIESKNVEPLPSYLHRLGADVIWRTNNWGEPPIQVTDYQKRDVLEKNCEGEGCAFDEILLTGLRERIASSDKQKIFVVLHTKGSHGPSYYSRYPARFEQFTPVCRYEELSKCSHEELINAYDNTLLYTDYFLTKIIQELKQLTDVPTMLVYASDHGESLGEKGLYLHGTPYLFAPSYQKDIPFLVWRSSAMKAQAANHQNTRDLSSTENREFSHANIFHTVLGAFGVESEAYQSSMDVIEMVQ